MVMAAVVSMILAQNLDVTHVVAHRVRRSATVLPEDLLGALPLDSGPGRERFEVLSARFRDILARERFPGFAADPQAAPRGARALEIPVEAGPAVSFAIDGSTDQPRYRFRASALSVQSPGAHCCDGCARGEPCVACTESPFCRHHTEGQIATVTFLVRGAALVSEEVVVEQISAPDPRALPVIHLEIDEVAGAEGAKVASLLQGHEKELEACFRAQPSDGALLLHVRWSDEGQIHQLGVKSLGSRPATPKCLVPLMRAWLPPTGPARATADARLTFFRQ